MAPKRLCNCGSCKRCKHREYMNRWYASKTPEERRAWRARRDPESVKEADRRKGVKRRRIDRVKVQARQQVGNAIKRGDLAKGDCEMKSLGDCDGKIEAHHDDYTRPLDVRWLCTKHHTVVDGRAV